MKIGITCYPTYGGSGVVATELGLELAERPRAWRKWLSFTISIFCTSTMQFRIR